MSSLLSLGFDYKGHHHSFLARVKEEGNKTDYYITVMNGELEKLLFGNHIITSIKGEIMATATDTNGEQHFLKTQIEKALARYLNERSLTSY